MTLLCIAPVFLSIQHLREVFDRLRAATLKLKPSKCSFVVQEVTFLGHVVSREGLKPDPMNIEKVRDWSSHQKHTEVWAFLGLCSYYRRLQKCLRHCMLSLKKETLFCRLTQCFWKSLSYSVCITHHLLSRFLTGFSDFSQMHPAQPLDGFCLKWMRKIWRMSLLVTVSFWQRQRDVGLHMTGNCGLLYDPSGTFNSIWRASLFASSQTSSLFEEDSAGFWSDWSQGKVGFGNWSLWLMMKSIHIH